MDHTDAVVGGSDEVHQRGSQGKNLAGPASQTREEWESESYSMKKDNMMGHVIIFNTRTIDKNFGLMERFGTDIDAENMEKLFSTFGFKVTVIKNATKSVMMRTLDKEAKEDHSSNNCFVCIILSHAENPRHTYATDAVVRTDDLMDKFKGHNCPSLAGKPKLFFVQACWGDVDPDFEYNCSDDETEPCRDETILPIAADFFLFENMVPGGYAWKDDRSKGSWFIQAVYDVFSSSWKDKDLHSMCTKVMAKMAELLSNDNSSAAPCDLPPIITTQLRKELHFFG